MALFPSVIPWTLFLTQVYDSWFSSGTPGRWATPVQKNACRLQVLVGWEQGGRSWWKGGGTQRSGCSASCWVCLPLRRKENSFALVKKKKQKKKEGRRGVLSSPPAVRVFLYRHGNTHTHTLTHSAMICMVAGGVRVVKRWDPGANKRPTLRVWPHQGLRKGFPASGIVKFRRRRERKHVTLPLQRYFESAF